MISCLNDWSKEAKANHSTYMQERTKKIASLNEESFILEVTQLLWRDIRDTNNIHFTYSDKENVSWWSLITFVHRTLSYLAMYTVYNVKNFLSF